MKISIKNVTKYFGTTSAVSDFSLALEERESLTLTGQNGAGKTTLLRMLAGFLRPDRGAIDIGGIDIYRAPLAARIALLRRVGVVLPENFFYRDLSIAENFELYSGLAEKRLEPELVAQLAKRFGILEHFSKPIRALSQGLTRRASLVRALLSSPRILLLDEPFAHLDESSVAELRNELASQMREGVTIVATGHGIEPILPGSRVCVLPGELSQVKRGGVGGE